MEVCLIDNEDLISKSQESVECPDYRLRLALIGARGIPHGGDQPRTAAVPARREQ